MLHIPVLTHHERQNSMLIGEGIVFCALLEEVKIREALFSLIQQEPNLRV
jgi:hypothetical protein